MHTYLEQARVAVEDAVNGMTDEQLLATRGEKWTATQIVEHLSLAFGATAKNFERIAAAQNLDVRRPSLRDRIATIAVCNLEYIPSGRKAPEYTVPSGLAPQDALNKLRDHLRAMDAAILRVEQRWGTGLVAVHPVIGPLTPNQWRKFHLVHARHHARQILAIKATSRHATTSAAA